MGRALSIGGGGDDEADQLFAAPALAHELKSQEVEQFRMRGRLTGGSKIIGRADEADSKKFAPQVVHRHPAGERVLR